MDHPDTLLQIDPVTGRRSFNARALDAGWLLFIAVLPLGHVTGAHNTLSVLVVLLSLMATRGRAMAQVPGLAWLVAFAAFACASLLWSPLPAVSGGKLRSDLLLPIFGYLAAFVWARDGGARAMFYGFALGLLLLAFFSLLELAPDVIIERLPGILPADPAGQRWAQWYPGVGDASADAILVIGPLLVWRRLAGQWRDATSALIALATVLIILVSKNRDAVFLFPFALALFALLWNLRLPARRARLIQARTTPTLFAAVAAVVTGALLLLEVISQKRLAEMHQMVPFGHAAMTLIALDPRPRMWAEFIRLGSAHALAGVGFGRTVPALAYDVAHDPVMIAAHANGFEHGHNYLLNVWLQLGFIGLALMIGAMATMLRRGWRDMRGAPLAALAGVGVLTLIVTTLLRNAVDDFLVYSTASAFWIALGLLFGVAARVRVQPGIATASG